jgi:DNA-directed RNA polymerase specialized sigma24 family protein
LLEARDDLAGALRDEALRVLTMNGVPAQARDDLAQAVTLTVLGRIEAGAVAPGFEDGYVAVAAKNRARDWHREESGVYDKRAMIEEDELPSTTPDPLAVLEHEENEDRMRALATRVAGVLEIAPPRYREALVAVYLDGVPIDTLVEQELVREWPWPDDDVRARARARARVDKVLQRARDWVRARVLLTEVAR